MLLTSLLILCAAPVVDDHDEVALVLEKKEQALRPLVKERLLAGGRVSSGDDPWALAQSPSGSTALLLRGAAQLLIDDEIVKVDPWPSAVAWDGEEAVVSSSVSGGIDWYGSNGSLHHRVDVGVAVTALSAGAGLVDAGSVDGDVITLSRQGVASDCFVGVASDVQQLVRLEHHLVVVSALGHRVVVFDLKDHVPQCDARQEIAFDGPLYAAVAREAGGEGGGGVDVIVSGLEDLPLDRSAGGFANIDSTAFGLRFTGKHVERRWEKNLVDEGVIIGLAVAQTPLGALIAGKGSGGIVEVTWDGDVVGRDRTAPGVQALLLTDKGVQFANVLADTALGKQFQTRLPKEEARGEELVFTSAMAPAGRFTCEACHLHGGVDGRLHNTGRLDAEGHAVTATTKPLWGLFQNPPLFTRALDRSVSVMIHAEFKVANRNTGHPAWFGGDEAAEADRAAAVAFFSAFDPPPNPRAWGRDKLSDDEARGFILFQRYCVDCHAPRVFADDPASVPADVEKALWQGALVWGRSGYEDVGVRPKVHPEGGRPSSLRGVSRKTPLLTNGSARDLEDFLLQIRPFKTPRGDVMVHDGGDADMSPRGRADLLAFLRLL